MKRYSISNPYMNIKWYAFSKYRAVEVARRLNKKLVALDPEDRYLVHNVKTGELVRL